MIKIEFKNGEIKEFSNMKEASQYEKNNNTQFKRIISK
jgi:hypothetical protein